LFLDHPDTYRLLDVDRPEFRAERRIYSDHRL
jgi:hypothetical protein